MPNYHKHWYGTLVQYNALATKDSNTLYHCSEGLIYRGSVLLATRRWGDLSGVPSTFTPSAHTHTKSQITDFPTTWAWASLTGVPSTFTPSAHTHDDRYYTETEVNTLLANKANWDTAYGWGSHASAGYALNSALTTHTGLTNNPHAVTKAQVGLGNVLNVASYSKAEVDSLASYVGAYHAPNGFLVKTNVARTLNSMLVLHIKGNSYGGIVPINTLVQVYNYTTNDAIIQTGALNNGYKINEIKVFYYDNLVYFWVPQQTSYMTMTFQLLRVQEQVNRVDSVTNAAIPASGVEKLVTITPRTAWFENTLTNLSQLTDNIGVGSHISNTSNPHGVTKSQVGLGSVDNTADSAKNVLSATKLTTTRKINGVDFNGTASITITANTPYTLTRGGYLTGSNFNGSANTTWAVDATSANTASKVVARDSNGDFACRVITASSGVYSLKVIAGGYNYATQTHGVGIGTDGSNSGVIFYNGTGATGRIYRESDVMRFIRGGLTYSGFDINADGSVTVQGDMTTRTSLVVGSTNGTYVQIGSARLVYDQTNNAIKVVNADNSSCSLYATGSISAFGIGSSGGSGTSYSRLDDWADYVDGLTNDYVLSAELGYDLHTRVNSLNSFQSGTSWGNSGTGIANLSIGGTVKLVSLTGHSHAFSAITSKPNTLGGYGITDAMSSTGGTLYGSNFQILEIKRNGTYGASMMFSNNNNVLGKFGFDPSSSLVIATGDSADAIPNMLYINGSTKQITGYGSLTVSGNIETGTSDGAYLRTGNVRFLYDNSVVGIRLLKVSGGYAPFYAGSVYANEVQLSSSRSMKKDIQPFKNGLDLIKSIDVVSYLYKQDADDDDRKIGFIADDTDSWLSGKSKTKYNIGNTVGALIKAVQELEKKNQELELRLLSITNNN